MTLFTTVFMVPIALVAVPAITLLVEVIAAICLISPAPAKGDSNRSRGRLAVLVPAHDESGGLIPTLNDIKGQLKFGDRLVVIADNCSDDTASVAASMGAEVATRSDPERIGKGYALDWGLNYLEADPPDIVIILDADCRTADGVIDDLSIACSRAQRPVQALYLMTAPAGSAVNHQVAEFAWRLKNWVRPLGLNELGLPCQLMGTGMAFPWQIIRSANLSSGFIVEDLKLGLDLASAGSPPMFLPSAVVTSTFPTTARGAEVQRHRWEQGHIGLILSRTPGLLYQAAKTRNIDQFALALDLMVPPLSLFGVVLFFIMAVATLAIFFGGSVLPFIASTLCVIMALAATMLAWLYFGRDILPLSSFALIAQYSFAKMKLYRAVILGRRISRWVRADRT